MSVTALSQRGQRFEFDVVILGAGIAGLSYALELSALRPEVTIALLCKNSLTLSNSFYAQGGIAATVALQADSRAKHQQDTLNAGDGLCDVQVVNTIIDASAEAIAFLQRWGVQFDQQGNTFDLAREGGHSERRIYHIGDYTGAGIIEVLTQRVTTQPQIKIFTYHTAVNLITQIEKHRPGTAREVVGAYVLDEKAAVVHTFLAKMTVLATGGAGKVYRYTTNPDVATGDGVAMAYRAGARVGNLEFFQFHPTLLYHPTLNNFLISEALRGEGARLLAPQTGERFMQRYAPVELELATRDVVARAIFSEIETTGYNYVYLDSRHHAATYLQQRFPSIYERLLSVGIDMARDCIPVVPAAHYLCGGVLTDARGKTDLSRLYAIGEVAFSGFHGANRLASNSLLEAVVMGRFAAQDHAVFLLANDVIYHKPIYDWDSQSVVDLRRASQINAHWRGLRGEMTSYAGIVRTRHGLEDMSKLIAARKKMIEAYYWQHQITRDLIELRNIVLLAELIVRSALMRHESRGGHFREDCPHRLPIAEETVLRNYRESLDSRVNFQRLVE